MHRQSFVDRAVADLPRSKAFFERPGCRFDARFTNVQGACLVPGAGLDASAAGARVLRHPPPPRRRSTRRGRPRCRVCLSCDSRAEVDAPVARAPAIGDSAPRAPQDHGFMCGYRFEDLDGHVREPVHVDPDASPATPAAV